MRWPPHPRLVSLGEARQERKREEEREQEGQREARLRPPKAGRNCGRGQAEEQCCESKGVTGGAGGREAMAPRPSRQINPPSKISHSDPGDKSVALCHGTNLKLL